MTADLLYLAVGLASGLALAHRHAVADAIRRAVDWLTTDPEPVRLVVARSCVRVVREGEGG